MLLSPVASMLLHASPSLFMLQRAKALRERETPSERRLWNAVRSNQLGAHFRRQHAVGSFVVDFACVTRRLVVEVDGGIHLDPDIAFADARRQQELELEGWRVMRVSDVEVMRSLSAVLARIRHELARQANGPPAHAVTARYFRCASWHAERKGARVRTLAAPYAPRRPTETPLYRVVRSSLETFLRWARNTYAKPVPRYVEQDLRAYLRCGVFAHGFTRARCDACGHDLLVAFSCKGRGVCPSCAGRRMANTAAHLVDRVLPDVPLRQYVLSLPHELRRLAAFDPKVLTALARIFADAIFTSHRRRARTAGLERVATGAVTCVQRFGGSLNLNIHFHTIVIDGVFVREPDGALGFVALPEPTRDQLKPLIASVARRSVAWLRRHGC